MSPRELTPRTGTRQQKNTTNDDIDLVEVMQTLWRKKLFILLCTALFTITVTIYSIISPDIYRATALLAPSEKSNTSNLSSIVGQLGGIASLAGVDVEHGQNNVTLALEVMKSRAFITNFIERHDLLAELMATNSWNQKQNTFTYNTDIYESQTKTWKKTDDGGAPLKPSLWKAYKEFTKKLNITVDQKTGLIRISIEHISPYTAKNWVDWLIVDINNFMRHREITQSEASKKYLEQELKQTSVSNMQQMFFQLIEKQVQKIMLANVRQDYIFSIIDPAIVPEEKEKPRRALTIAIAFLLSFIISSGFSLIIPSRTSDERLFMKSEED